MSQVQISNSGHCIWWAWINHLCKSGPDPIDCKSSYKHKSLPRDTKWFVLSALWGLANCWIRQGQLAWAPVSGSNILLSFVAKLEILWTGGLVAMFSWISQYWVWGWTNISTLSPGHDERIVFWFSHKSKYFTFIRKRQNQMYVNTLLIYFTTETLCLGHWKRQEKVSPELVVTGWNF